MGMKMRLINLLLLLLISCSTYAQQSFREFGVNDSTEYVLNGDTTIIVAPTKLYVRTIAGVSLLYNFSSSGLFIKDFDMVAPDNWYAILGDQSVLGGQPAELFQSEDQGNTWVADTSFYAVSKPAATNSYIVNHDAIHQMNYLSEDTIVIFLGYYQCAIFYSTNGGDSWNFWFHNLITNYKGLFECQSDYYLWAIEGDGFKSSMFKIPGNLLLSPDTSNVWSSFFPNNFHPDCHNGNTPECIYAPSSIGGYGQYAFLRII